MSAAQCVSGMECKYCLYVWLKASVTDHVSRQSLIRDRLPSVRSRVSRPTSMDDRLWAGKPSRYVTNYVSVQLSLKSLRGRQIEYQPVWGKTRCNTVWCHVSDAMYIGDLFNRVISFSLFWHYWYSTSNQFCRSRWKIHSQSNTFQYKCTHKSIHACTYQ